MPVWFFSLFTNPVWVEQNGGLRETAVFVVPIGESYAAARYTVYVEAAVLPPLSVQMW